jgi:hypothetical protein
MLPSDDFCEMENPEKSPPQFTSLLSQNKDSIFHNNPNLSPKNNTSDQSTNSH